MASILDYSTTAGSNTTVGGVSVAEGMTPGSVNNAMRAMMADSRKAQIDISGVTTSAGAGNAYTFVSSQGITAYSTGMRFCFEADKTNSGAATFNVDGVGAKAIKLYSTSGIADVGASSIQAGAIYDVVYEAGADCFVILNAAGASLAGLTASTSELNILDGATVTTAELNILDGATVTTAELNVLDGIPGTLTATELGRLDGVTGNVQTQLDAKAPLASPTFTGTPAAPTAAPGTDTTQLATTEFVTAAVAAVGGGGWEPFNGTDGIVYSHAVTGNVADVESAALDDGYEYLAFYDGVSVSSGTTAFNIGLYRDTSAAYAGDVPLGSVPSSEGWSGFSYIMAPRVTAKQHHVQSQFLTDGSNATTLAAITGYAVQHTTRQKIGKFRWRFSSNNIDAGIIYLYRRAFTA